MNKNTGFKFNKVDDINSVFEDTDEYNFYYESVSIVFRVFSFILFAGLLLFVISTAIIGAGKFSYANLEYITRNFALTLEENKDSTRQPIRYNPDPLNQFSLFGEGLVVCGGSSVSIYSATGRQTCSEIFQFGTPVMVSSDKYVLVYDDGGDYYTVYNSFSSVHTDVLNNSIVGAAVADNGYYALLLSSDEYNSTVEVYNSDFSLINRYNKNGYVSCMDITDSEVLIVTADTDLGISNYNIEILASKHGEPQSKFTVDLQAGFPLGCKITSFGYAVVYTDSVIFLNESGDIIGNYMFGKNLISDFALSQTNVILLFESKDYKTANELVCIDSNGSVLYQTNIYDTVFDIELYDSRALILTENSILCIDRNLQTEKQIETSDKNCRLYAIDSDRVYYCSDTYATFFNGVFD